MLTHENIWRGIDRLASSFGYSASGLAKKAGLDPTSFNRSKRVSADGKPRWPSTESLAKVLSVTGATMSDFISMIGQEDVEITAHKRRTVPMIGFAQAGLKGYFDEEGYPTGTGWQDVDFPDVGSSQNEHIFALQVSGDSMEPLYRKGDLLIVAPQSRIRNGDRVVIKTKGGEVLLKELIKQSGGKVVLKSLNPAFEDRTLDSDEVVWMARIMWLSQ